VPTLCEEWNRFNIHDSPCGLMMTLVETVLGVSPAAPGYTACRIEPRLGSLEWARGTVPAPSGDITVSWRQSQAGELAFEIATPPGVPVELVLPRPTGEFRLTVDGGVTTRACVCANILKISLPGGAHAGHLSLKGENEP
jgi:hypothetical protein